MKTSRLSFLPLALVLAMVLPWSTPGFCMDEIRMLPGASEADKRPRYPETLLTMAMKATEAADGPFAILHSPFRMPRNRALEELVLGQRINVYLAATRPEWEERALVVRIPVLRGIQSYRLFLIQKQNQDRLAEVRTLADLKELRAGSGAQWTITKVMAMAGFQVVPGNSYEGLFAMLDMGRFDYFPRGLNEIYAELPTRQKRFPDLMVEPTLALHCPLPNYFFISPKNPELADRIRRGLEILVQNGRMQELFEEWFGPDLKRARLDTRRILCLDNPLLSHQTPLNRPELWLVPADCKK